MKDNYNTTIEGVKVKLVPYRPEHVPTYHAWMQNEALLEATASERLKLDEEYAMQRTWAEDAGKCTFIILDRERHEERPGLGGHGGAMAGDVNLFWNDHDDPQAAEIEVMVAETASRRKGIAQEALHLLMAYASTRLSVSSFTAKVGFDNAASQALFGKLGFTEVNRVEVFREIVFRLDVAGCVKLQLQQRADAMRLGEYD